MNTQTCAPCLHPRLFFFPLSFLRSNRLQSCVPHWCKANYKKIQRTSSPNLSTQSRHANLFWAAKGPLETPPQTQISHLRQSQKQDLRNDKIYANQIWAQTHLQPENDRFNWCVSLLQPNINWLTYTGVCVILVSSHSTHPIVWNCAFPLRHLCTDMHFCCYEYCSKITLNIKVWGPEHCPEHWFLNFCKDSWNFLEQDFASTDQKQLSTQPEQTRPQIRSFFSVLLLRS